MEVAFLSQGIDIVPKHIVSAETEFGIVVFAEGSDATIIATNQTNRDKLVSLVKLFSEGRDEDAVSAAMEFSRWFQTLKMAEVETDGA